MSQHPDIEEQTVTQHNCRERESVNISLCNVI